MMAATVVQELCKFAGFVLCFIVCFILLVIAPLCLHRTMNIIVIGDGGRRSTCPSKIREKYFSGNYFEKFGHFSGKNHVTFGNFVNFSGKYHTN